MTLALERTYPDSYEVDEHLLADDEPAAASLNRQDPMSMESGTDDVTPEETIDATRSAFALGLITGPEAFQRVSQAYSERAVHGIDEVVARRVGGTVLSPACTIASGPSAAFRKLIRTATPSTRPFTM